MFGIRFIKSQPTVHLMQFRAGKVVREGSGLSFFYYGPTTTLVAVPVASQDRPFILELVTADFQSVTVQGQVTYRISDPRRTAAMMDFSLAKNGQTYVSEDPKRLGDRVAQQVEVIVQQAVQAMELKAALRASAAIARTAQAELAAQPEIAALGLEILGVSVMAVKPTPDIARALEAEARESNLKAADDAVYLRRMSAVENERAIRQNELDTDIAVEQKKRQIRETQMEAKATLMRKENALRNEQMAADVELEGQRKAFVTGQAENSRTLAEAEAYRVAAVMQALEKADPRIVNALAAAGMQPGQLIAQAFGGIAERAERIGQLNVSPDLLQGLMNASTGTTGRAAS
ncbi:MAG: SPFH domain-containing protein [Pseudomonadota bacterium]|uniref:SPFH domain-containing protein n=1 Tax=Ralstonia pickettii TaxID=329 RepID=UPI0027150A04|nr:SPFH domain-containing protein [Ralstonia pickettii]MEE2978538.1 SPFH domain-containing protein [Pseudomonadota bacterium]WKZ87415.1 SPFH domain-containing protein [Ralstonia pickettii]